MARLVAAVLCLALASPALAKEEAKENPQQNRMKVCNEKAAGKKGDDRKAFMSKCLKGEDEEAKKGNAQQDRMKACNEQAAGKKGDDRKAFMSACLKG